MPDSGFLFLSAMSVCVGAMLFLAPDCILKTSQWLNKTLVLVDQNLLRHRYVAGLLAFGAGYAFFKLALLLPSLH